VLEARTLGPSHVRLPRSLYLWGPTGDQKILYHRGPPDFLYDPWHQLSMPPVNECFSLVHICISRSVPFMLEASYKTVGDKLMNLTNSSLKTLDPPSTHSLIDELKWVPRRSYSGWRCLKLKSQHYNESILGSPYFACRSWAHGGYSMRLRVCSLLEGWFAWYRYQDDLRHIRLVLWCLPNWLQWPSLCQRKSLHVGGTSFNY